MARKKFTYIVKKVIASSNIRRKGKTIKKEKLIPLVSTENVIPWGI